MRLHRLGFSLAAVATLAAAPNNLRAQERPRIRIEDVPGVRSLLPPERRIDFQDRQNRVDRQDRQDRDDRQYQPRDRVSRDRDTAMRLQQRQAEHLRDMQYRFRDYERGRAQAIREFEREMQQRSRELQQRSRDLTDRIRQRALERDTEAREYDARRRTDAKVRLSRIRWT